MALLWKASKDGLVADQVGEANIEVGTNRHDIIRIISVPAKGGVQYALISHPKLALRVNGRAVVAGLQVLKHKDELQFGDRQMFFSAESVPKVTVYRHDGAKRRPHCPVCRAEIEDGQHMVVCPGCSRRYHQIATAGDATEKPCWTYRESCRFCEQPTSLSGQPNWRPDAESIHEWASN
ncbi:MAG: hypothetical protein HKN47_10950 [Pirellulaceae bacterium]|nr:hypothetical protein [Pirellulaceae bacterium]